MTDNMMDRSNLSTRGRVKRFTAFMLILAMLITGLPVSGFNLKEVKAADPPETGEYTGGMQYYDYMTQKWSEFLWYRSFESLWEAAVSHPGQQVYVKLFKDVKADNTKYRSFGKGKGFKDGAIYVPKGSSIRLDLAGHMIDRHLTLYDLSDPLNYWGGYSVIRVDEDSTLTVEDSKPYVQHDGYYDEDLGVWFPKYRYNDLVTYPSKRINLNRVVPIYGGIICGGAATYGGGISNSSRNAGIILEGGNIVGNVAKYGGGLGDDCARVWIKGGTIAYNYAAENGGGVFTKSAENKWRDVGDDSQDLLMTGGVIMRNTCKNQGGGVYADCTDHAISLSRKVMQFNDGVICANYANEGGGLFQNQGRVELNGGLINGNWAKKSGGGVYANGYMNNLIQGRDNLLVINGATITENTANWGGGLYVNTKKCKIGSATITNNEARYGAGLPGGGIYIADHDFLQFTGGKIIVQDNVQTPTGARSNISCETLKDFNGEHNYNHTLGSGSCVYVNFRNKTLEEGLTFGDYLSGTPGTIQLDDDRFYAVPNEDSARYWVVMKNYYQNWRIKMKVGNEPAAAVGDKEYSYINKDGNSAKAIAKRGEVGYASVIDMRDMRTSYYYTDAYFRTYQDGTGANVYDHHLATMSAALAMSAFRRPYKGAENQGKNVRELMENLGMSDIELTYPEPARKGDNDYTIGYAIGKKTLTEGDNKGKTLITIATRGANYMTEWGSNTTLNYKDYFKRQAAGFSDAADKVTQGVSDYLSKHNLNGKSDEIVFWITGYSRGGATANLTAQRLTDRYNGEGYGDGNRIYAYPIEAPQGAYQQYASGTGYGNKPEKAPKEYKNIHNIINPSDLVPLVAPAAMGFSRFGVDHLIPGNTDLADNSPVKFPYVAYSENGSNTAYKTTKEEMVKQLAAIDTRIGFNDRFQHSTMSFINNTIHGHDMINLNGDMDAPENWYGGFLQGLLHYALISEPDEKKSSEVPQITYRRMYSESAPVGLDANGVPRLAYGDKNAEKVSVQTALETAIVLVFGLDDETSKKLTERLGRCSVALDKGYKCSDGTTLEMSSMYTGFIRKWKGLKTDEKNAKIKELWELVSLAGLDSVLSKQQYNDFRKIFPVLVDFAMKSVSWDWKKANSNNLGTLLANAETIAEAHYPEVNLAWLRAQDSFFKNDGKNIYIGRRVVFDPVQAIETKITNKDGKTAKKSQDAEVYDTYLEDEIRLNLSTKTSGAKILYTLNGEDPKLRSYGVKVYDGPIRLTSKQGVRKLYNIRMVACKDGVYSPETNYRCDVYPGGDKYTLTVRYEGDRSETFRLRKGDTIELFKTTRDRTYKWKSWDLVSYSGSGDADSDWDEISKKKDEELNKLIKENGQRSTKLEMPAKDVEIEGVYVKLADNVHLQYEPHTRFTKDSKVEWCVETEEENFCSPNYVLPSDADEDDYTIVDAYPRLYVYGNGLYGQQIELEFVPSAMSEDMPEFTDISLDEDVPDGMSVASSADGVMDLYINDVYVANGKRHKTNRTGDGTPYGIIEAIYKNSEMCARVSFEEFPLISAEFGKTDHLFVFKNGTPKEEILTKFPEFTSFKSGGCSYLIKNIWPDDLLKNYDPNKSSTQRFEIYAQPDEKDFKDRYPNLNTGDLKIFEKYRSVKPKCTISVRGYDNAYIPWIYIERAPGDSGEGTKANPYKNDVKIKIKNSENNKDLVNYLLHYSVDGGKTYKTCSANEVEIVLYNPKTDKDGCATICAYVTADRVWGGGSSPRVKRFYIKPTRNVKLNLALLSGMFKSHYGKRWTVSKNGLGGTIKESPANESVYLNGVMYYSRYKDVGLIREYSIKYGNGDPEIKEVNNLYSGLEGITLGDITRDASEKIEDVTISGIYDLGIDKVKLELDEDKLVDKIKIWVHTYVDENGEKPSDDLIELDEDKYEANYGENPNEIIIKLKEGEGYSWCSTGTIKKADDDTVIDSLNAKNGTCSYELRVELRNENKEYPVWIGLTAEDDPSGDDYVLDYFKKGDTVNLVAPDWESHTFKQWIAEGVTITNPTNPDNASFTMSANEVRIRAEYDCYENIGELTLKIPKVLAYNELPDGSTVSADIVSGNNVAAASFAGWQDKAPGFNREVKAAVKLIPQKGYEFREKTGSDVAVDTNFKVKIEEAEAVENAVVKATLLDDGSVLAIVKQTTDKGSVASIDWRTTEISVSANAIDDDDDLLGLVPDKVTVNCTNPKSGGDAIPVVLGVTKSTPENLGENKYSITATLADGDEDIDFGSVSKSQNYTITLTERPLNVKSIDWGRDEVFRISKDAKKEDVMKSVPNEVWVTFTREGESTDITMSVSVNKTDSTEMGNPIVTAELGIKTDNEGTDGYTNKDNVALTHVYTFEVPDYHSVYVTDGTAAGNTVRNFDKPEWVTDASAPGQGELKWLEENDVVTVTAAVKNGQRFVRWDVSGTIIDDVEDPVLCFDMADNDVSITAVYDNAIDDISPEISADRKRVESVNINGSGVLDASAYTASVTGNKVSIVLNKGCGWFFDNETKLNENEEVMQSITRTGDYSADFVMWPEKLYVSVSTVDDKGSVISGTEETHIGIYEEGNKVETSCPDVDGYKFKEWKSNVEGLALTTGENNSVSFTMPDKDVRLSAVFVPYDTIDHVTLQIDAPQARQALPENSVITEADGGNLDNTKTKMMWSLSENEIPDYGEEVTAIVTLAPDENSKFITSGDNVYTLFELEEDDEYREIDDVMLLPDGSVDLYIDFTTDKRRLTSIDWGDTDITGGMTITGELSGDILPDVAELKFADAKSDEDPVLREITWPSLSANIVSGNSVSGNKIRKTETDEAFIYTIIGELDLSEDVGDDDTGHEDDDDTDSEEGEMQLVDMEDYDEFLGENSGWLDTGDVPLTQTFTVTLLKEPKPNKPYIDIAISDVMSKLDISFVADATVSECNIRYDYAFAVDDEELNIPEPSGSDKTLSYNAVSVSDNKVTVSVDKAAYEGKFVTFGIKAITETKSTSEPARSISSNTAVETVEFYIPGDRSLSVNAKDTSDKPCIVERIDPDTGKTVGTTGYSFDDLTKGSEVDLFAPAAKDAVFFRWEIPSGISVSANATVVTVSGNVLSGNTLSENNTEIPFGMKGITNSYITLTMPDSSEKTTHITARYKPVVKKVSVEIEEPKADKVITPLKLVKLTISDEYTVNSANYEYAWSGTVSKNGAEYFDPEATEYTLDIELKPDDGGNISLKPVKGGTDVTMRADEIIFSQDAEVTINGQTDDYAFLGTEDDGRPYLVCGFDNTQMYEDLDDGPDKEAVVGSVIDNVFGIYNDEEGQYEYTFDKVKIDNSWKADISDRAGRSLYIRYRAVDDDPESKWTTIELPPSNDDMPAMTYYYTNGTIGFEGVDKWQYRLNGQSEWKNAPSAIVSPDELGWDGTATGIEVRRAGDQTRFPGRSSQIVLKARPAAPTGFTVSDNSAAIRGTVTGTFDSAAGKQIEVQVRYPDRSDDWTAYHQGRFITVDENGRFIIDKLADSRADIRIRVFEEGEMPSQWATASVRIDKDRTISDENLIEKRYSVNYVFEYGGQRLVETTGYVYTKDLKGYDGKVYGISANREWFDERAREMFGSDSKNAIVSFVIKGRSGNSDGRAAAVAGDKESETVLATIEASKFKDNSGKVAYGSIPVDYNEITVYARIGSFATMRDTTEGVYISSPLPVGYTGLAHRLNVEPSSGKPNSGKSGSYDLELEVRDTSSTDENGDSYTLVYGKDYTVSYKNNVNASVKYDPSSGKYTPLYTDTKTAEKKSPQMTIKGKGNYRSLKAVVYFDILPLDLTAESGSIGRFESGQIKSSYILNKNGGIKLSIKPVRYARIFDKVKGVYATDDKKRVNYGSKDITMMLQRLDDASGSWDNVGSLDKKDAKETLKKVTTPGEYRIRYSGLGNFYGTGLYDGFKVYKHGDVLFSTLKVKTTKKKYSSGGVSANELVTGITTKVKNAAGSKVKLTPEDYSVSLEAVSDSAEVTDDKAKAMSAGTYKATVWYGDISAKYPGLVPDKPIEVTVTVTGEKLKTKMVTLDWNDKGEDYNGKSKDVTVKFSDAKASEVTLAKRVMKDGKEQFIPLTDAEFAAAVKDVKNDSFTVKGSYGLSDGSKTDNTLPGKYTITLYGKGKYGGSVLTKTYKRLPVKLTSEMLKASDTAFNIGGVETEISISSNAIGLDEITYGKGDDDYSVTYSGVKKATVSGNMIGTATATVKVKSETTGLKKGSSAKVTFNVYERSAYILRYEDYSYEDPGALYIQVAGDVKSGSKPPKLTLYQSSEDGTKLKKIPQKYYTAAYTREPVVEGYESAAPSFAVKISAGKEKGYNFTARGITIGSAYSEYKNKAKKWGDIKLSGKAAVIRDEGNGMSYTDRNIDSYASAMINVDMTGKTPVVSYVGNSYILPIVDEVVVDGITLKRADSDFIVTYKKNNKPGTAGMTITLTPGGSDKTMVYPLGGSKSFNFKIVEQKNKDLKL